MASKFITDRQSDRQNHKSLTQYIGKGCFFLFWKFSTSLLALLAGAYDLRSSLISLIFGRFFSFHICFYPKSKFKFSWFFKIFYLLSFCLTLSHCLYVCLCLSVSTVCIWLPNLCLSGTHCLPRSHSHTFQFSVQNSALGKRGCSSLDMSLNVDVS